MGEPGPAPAAAAAGSQRQRPPCSRCFQTARHAPSGRSGSPALGAAVHGAENAQDIQPVVQVPQQVVDTHVPPASRRSREGLQKRFAVLAFIGGQCVIEIPLRASRPDHGQPVRREAEQRRAQYRDQRHILAGIVHDLQRAHDHADLHGVEEVPALLKGTGNVLPARAWA